MRDKPAIIVLIPDVPPAEAIGGPDQNESELSALVRIVVHYPHTVDNVNKLKFGKATWAEAFAEACRSRSVPQFEEQARRPMTAADAKKEYEADRSRQVQEMNWLGLVKQFDPALYERLGFPRVCTHCAKHIPQGAPVKICPVCKRVPYCRDACKVAAVWHHQYSCTKQ